MRRVNRYSVFDRGDYLTAEDRLVRDLVYRSENHRVVRDNHLHACFERFAEHLFGNVETAQNSVHFVVRFADDKSYVVVLSDYGVSLGCDRVDDFNDVSHLCHSIASFMSARRRSLPLVRLYPLIFSFDSVRNRNKSGFFCL